MTRKYNEQIANATKVLDILSFNITLEIIKEIINLTFYLNIHVHNTVSSEFYVLSSNKKKQVLLFVCTSPDVSS